MSYGYDPQGNRNSLTATVGAEDFTITNTCDPLNRLATVVDSQGGVTAFGYDANGNRTSLAFPNGVTTSYTYNTLDRLTELRSETTIGDVLLSPLQGRHSGVRRASRRLGDCAFPGEASVDQQC
ncbi:MAG: hypothetical protein GY708_11850 [Actinomycetia bacterium]|nr:hypothetical protein [Actinomycetes bacterium]